MMIMQLNNLVYNWYPIHTVFSVIEYFAIRDGEDAESHSDTTKQVFLSVFITSLAEFPGLFLSAYLVDKYVSHF